MIGSSLFLVNKECYLLVALKVFSPSSGGAFHVRWRVFGALAPLLYLS